MTYYSEDIKYLTPTIQISEIADYIKPQLVKPKIIDPAVYLDPGVYPLSKIPYDIIHPLNLDIINTHFTLHEEDPYIEVKVEGNESFYLINNKYRDPLASSYDSHENHIRFGYGKNPIYSDKLHKLPWCEIYGKGDNRRGTWWEECQIAAHEIKKKYQDVAVLMSGGLDSEMVACSFLDAGISFRPYFMKYYGFDGQLLNFYDWEYVQRFCDLHELKLDIEEIDIIDDICDRRYLDYFIDGLWETYFPLTALYTHNYAIEKFNKLGFVPVFGQDQVEIKMDENNKPSLGDSFFMSGNAAAFWAHEKGYHNIYNFFTYTPNQVLSYIDIPEVKNVKKSGYDFKKHIAKKYSSDKLLKIDREKATGYEYVQDGMRDKGKQYHDFTLEVVDMIDWSKRPMTQYIHNFDHILEHNEMCQFKVIRTTTKDWFCSGFKQGVPDYYDL